MTLLDRMKCSTGYRQEATTTLCFINERLERELSHRSVRTDIIPGQKGLTARLRQVESQKRKMSDVNNDVDSLIISASSSNQSLVPDANIILSGSGADRILTITPANISINEPTDVTITVSVSDGAATTSTSFTLIVRPAGSDSFIYLPLIIRSEP